MTIYKPNISQGDPNQKPTGANIVQPASNFTSKQISAAHRAEQAQALYTEYKEKNAAAIAAAEKAEIERKWRPSKSKRFLRPDEIA